MVILMLARHAEAIKNLRGVHGGPGTPLTPDGEKLAVAFASVCARHDIQRILFIPKEQTAQTARIVAARMAQQGRRVSIAEFLFAPYGLGILDGLSDEAVRARFPELSTMMLQYRAGDIELGDVNIPGAEDGADFVRRVRAAVETLKTLETPTAIFATRSFLVGFINVLAGRSPGHDGGYREIYWPHLAYSCVDLGSNSYLQSSECLTLPKIDF